PLAGHFPDVRDLVVVAMARVVLGDEKVVDEARDDRGFAASGRADDDGRTAPATGAGAEEHAELLLVERARKPESEAIAAATHRAIDADGREHPVAGALLFLLCRVGVQVVPDALFSRGDLVEQRLRAGAERDGADEVLAVGEQGFDLVAVDLGP